MLDGLGGGDLIRGEMVKGEKNILSNTIVR